MVFFLLEKKNNFINYFHDDETLCDFSLNFALFFDVDCPFLLFFSLFRVNDHFLLFSDYKVGTYLPLLHMTKKEIIC